MSIKTAELDKFQVIEGFNNPKVLNHREYKYQIELHEHTIKQKSELNMKEHQIYLLRQKITEDMHMIPVLHHSLGSNLFNSLCEIEVYTPRILRFEQIKSLSAAEGLLLLKHVILGLINMKKLYNMPAVLLDQGCFGVTQEGKGVVWLNRNYAINYPEQSVLRQIQTKKLPALYSDALTGIQRQFIDQQGELVIVNNLIRMIKQKVKKLEDASLNYPYSMYYQKAIRHIDQIVAENPYLLIDKIYTNRTEFSQAYQLSLTSIMKRQLKNNNNTESNQRTSGQFLNQNNNRHDVRAFSKSPGRIPTYSEQRTDFPILNATYNVNMLPLPTYQEQPMLSSLPMHHVQPISQPILAPVQQNPYQPYYQVREVKHPMITSFAEQPKMQHYSPFQNQPVSSLSERNVFQQNRQPIMEQPKHYDDLYINTQNQVYTVNVNNIIPQQRIVAEPPVIQQQQRPKLTSIAENPLPDRNRNVQQNIPIRNPNLQSKVEPYSISRQAQNFQEAEGFHKKAFQKQPQTRTRLQTENNMNLNKVRQGINPPNNGPLVQKRFQGLPSRNMGNIYRQTTQPIMEENFSTDSSNNSGGQYKNIPTQAPKEESKTRIQTRTDISEPTVQEIQSRLVYLPIEVARR